MLFSGTGCQCGSSVLSAYGDCEIGNIPSNAFSLSQTRTAVIDGANRERFCRRDQVLTGFVTSDCTVRPAGAVLAGLD